MPAYNAARTIEGVFARIPHQIREEITEYVVVDDGSTDDTLAVLDRIQKRFPQVTVLRHPENKGYGAAEKTLLNYVREKKGEIAILLHSDGQYAPEKIPELMQPLKDNEADIVQGSRMLSGGALRGGMPVYKFVANKLLTSIENLAFGLSLAEYHSGYMLYHSRALDRIDFNALSTSFDFDLEMIVAASVLGLRVKEMPIPTRYEEEVSHLNPIKYGFDVLKVVYRYKRGYYHVLLEKR
ncbi:MAG: glycosyltransferase family 2 protein [Proteobacteria bacterium]|nr:glycosyltransferase family 2 protein [Pseudomonadota bacterium]MBU1234834.1 glycosyltransferase family 2 protein [Pseudomonadota bacterium]MBU1420615.1 glycosyltransferase family 2 protein [Pseudomonadota bacterium]MBU1456618.1 glycosyltransferase family 2 protein [Pseudomonadota bacterium]